ncbi:MAG: HlyD family secretion protein [Gammaproteobacteria bacterium]
MAAANETNHEPERPERDEQALAVTKQSTTADTETGKDLVEKRWLPGSEFVSTSVRSSGARRGVGWVALALIIALAVIPIGIWIRYASDHVTSTNAIVRGHLGEIGTQLDGIVTQVEVDAGDRVFADQVLVRLEDRQLRAEALEARATVDALEQRIEVERLAIGHEQRRIEQQVQESSAALRAADAQSDAAQIRAEDALRFQELREELFEDGGAVSGEDLRDADTERRTAEALYLGTLAEQAVASSARDKARLANDALAIRERQIGILQSELLQAEARVSKAEADLDGATIRAPADGAIVRRIVQAGGSVEVGQPIISMWLGKDVWIEAWIDEDDIADVALGSQAMVTMNSFPGREFTGIVENIGLTTDFEMPESEVPQPRNSRMRGAPVVGVRIQLDNPPAELLPGLSAIVAIEKPTD